MEHLIRSFDLNASAIMSFKGKGGLLDRIVAASVCGVSDKGGGVA